jgi:hypothetical protein
MGDTLEPNGVSMGCSDLASRSMYPRCIVHEADEPNVGIDLAQPEGLAGEDGGDDDAPAMQADGAVGGDDGVEVVEGIGEFGQAREGAR